MTGYRFHLTCPACGALMEHRTGGAVTLTGTCALADCRECGAQYRVDVRVQRLSAPKFDGGDPMPSMVTVPEVPSTEFGRRLVAAFLDAEGGK